MPDTPRTVSELLAIFADNASGDISAQDMRDLVESLANPVSDGFPAGPDDDNIALFHFLAHNSIGADAWTLLTANAAANYDPGGWLGTGTYDDDQLWSGGTLSEGQWVALPEGVYVIQGTSNVSSAVTSAVLGLGMADARVSQDESLDPFVQYGAGNETEIPIVFGVPATSDLRVGTHMFLRVKRSLAPEHFAFVFRQRSGGSVNLTSATLAVMRITPTVPS